LTKTFSFKLAYYLVVGGFSALGEETGWRGFLQGALRPMGKIRGYLLLSLLWAGWHFTSQTGGTWQGLASRLEILIPTVIAVTFLLAWLTEHTGSLLLAATFHEWLDIGVDSGGYLLWVALASIPVWIWLVWKWPRAKSTSPSREPAPSVS
jgi:membrane protease YdiL (CAAX protease family)